MSKIITVNKQLQLVYKDPYKFGHWAGFEDLTETHNDWIKRMLYGKKDMTLLAHRGSYKTTALSIAMALMVIIYPQDNIIFFRKTDTDVIEIIKQTKKILMTESVQILSQTLYNRPIKLLKDSSYEIDTNLKDTARGSSQIVGAGIKTSITGKHGDKVITDDIVNVKDRISKAERDFTKLQYQELQNIKNRGGRIINTGTPWHKEDAISTMPNVKRYSIHDTNLISRDEEMALRDSMTASLFAANYELKHIANEDAIFTAPQYTDKSVMIEGGIAHIDASYGGKDGTAFTIIRKTGNTLIGFGKLWKKHVDECLNEIELYHKEFKAGTVYTERNADKGYLAKELKSRDMPTSTYHEKQNKFIKITTYLRKEWNNIYWIDGTDPSFMNEILDYTENAEHDDAPDSAASLVRVLNKKPVVNLFEGGL